MDKRLRHAVAVLAHDDMEMLARLVNGFDDDFDFYIHIDRNWTDFSKEAFHKLVQGVHTVSFYSWQHVKWGSIDIVKTQMRLVSNALANKSYDYVHLMSGHDILLSNCKEVKDFFTEHCGEEFMEYHNLPFSDWEGGTLERLIRFGLYDLLDYNKTKQRNLIETIIKLQRKIGLKRSIPSQYQQLYGGSNWMSLTSDCWRYILSNYKKSFLRRLRFTFASDEVFFHTVVMNSKFAKRVTGNNLRLIRWSSSGAVKTLTKYDWWTICNSNSLIARKVSHGVSDELVNWIEECRRLSGTPEEFAAMRRIDSDIAEILKKIVDALAIRSSCEFLCRNGIYVRFLRNLGVNAHGLDTDEKTSDITQRLFPSGFHCHTAALYNPVAINIKVDLALALSNWRTNDNNANSIFLNNIASASRKYVLIKNEPLPEYAYNEQNKPLDIIMGKYGFSRNKTLSRILCEGATLNKENPHSLLFYERNKLDSSLL